mgnify:CR=1 FL=1
MTGGIDPEIDAALGKAAHARHSPGHVSGDAGSTEPSGEASGEAPGEPSAQGLDLLDEICALHAELKHDRTGSVATYIPALAGVDPDTFAISVVTVAGEMCSVGDSATRFTLQSIVAPFLYGYVLDEAGRAGVLERVGVEPSGNPFQEIVLSSRDNRPMNPMINAGALAIASMLPGEDGSDRLSRMLDRLGLFVGRRPGVDMLAYVSEKTTADRNRSIAYLMRNFGGVRGEVEPLLDLYTQACAVSVTSDELAVMAATLANAGVNPRTGERAVQCQSLRDVLTVMFTCGLYEASGLWAYRVGVPAKSGVGGGIIAVVPGIMGIGVYSPRLDESGNSARGMRVCDRLIGRLGLHVFGGGRSAAAIDEPIEDVTEAEMIHGREWIHETPGESDSRDGPRDDGGNGASDRS